MAQAKKNVGEKVKTEETQSFSFDAIKGKSEGMQQAVALARKVSATDVTVLLTGETGTGKEVFCTSHPSQQSSQRECFCGCKLFCF